MKQTPPAQIIEAVRTILRGGLYVSKETSDRFLETLSDGVASTQFGFPLERLTDREMEIFELIGQGKNSHEVAANLKISPRKVDAHRTRIRTELRIPDSNALHRRHSSLSYQTPARLEARLQPLN